MFSRYLYSKVKEATTKFISVYLTQNEVDFLDFYQIFHERNGDYYVIDSYALKTLFCN